MLISFDLRMAHLPGGGRVYVQKLLPTLAGEYPHIRWRLYYNHSCPAQREIIENISSLDHLRNNPEHLELRQVRSGPLTLSHHIEFLPVKDDASLYHYLHFDMPWGMRGLPLVMTIHDLYPLTVKGYCSGMKRAYFYRVARHNAHRATRIITISNYSRKDIVQYLEVDEKKVIVIPQSHAGIFRPIDDCDYLNQVRRKYHLPEKFIFYTGNHKPHKNLARLIRAYGKLPESLRREYTLVLTGAVTQQGRKLLDLSKESGLNESVMFTGWVDDGDLPGLYNLASLLVQPSLYEGFGLAPLEALACGTPVACSNATAI
ncbi:MAG: glycosyltransferase family 4 protein, partial [Sedimentisphaerales bacterium]|nr:glycosyltransferase family 4 protein [Sedimentisphaerales bacterium]